MTWQDDASCKGRPTRFWFATTMPPELMVGRAVAGDPYAYGRSICNRCPVREACLTYALEAGERHGLWGGLDEAERHALRKRTKPVRKAPDHGTERGYKQHKRLGEDACQPCVEANRAKNGYYASKVAV